MVPSFVDCRKMAEPDVVGFLTIPKAKNALRPRAGHRKGRMFGWTTFSFSSPCAIWLLSAWRLSLLAQCKKGVDGENPAVTVCFVGRIGIFFTHKLGDAFPFI